ncbi:hypothetical protein QWY31_00465 [Cytophagales bacterium LB-30]|uniref:Uncharacterized protein n=1 Tax=Shiella aurantiaca TaxID=3058365 RepID=A0ABT8F0I4_9BACT|nr:hypothetical protein [Shiella aurantiaca]MDN4163948.1 hypothetical protein [Shiella aurantiaca]
MPKITPEEEEAMAKNPVYIVFGAIILLVVLMVVAVLSENYNSPMR